MKTPPTPPSPASADPAPPPQLSVAFQLGRTLQVVLLVIAIIAVALRLVRMNDALQFRYGGF